MAFPPNCTMKQKISSFAQKVNLKICLGSLWSPWSPCMPIIAPFFHCRILDTRHKETKDKNIYPSIILFSKFVSHFKRAKCWRTPGIADSVKHGKKSGKCGKQREIQSTLFHALLPYFTVYSKSLILENIMAPALTPNNLNRLRVVEVKINSIVCAVWSWTLYYLLGCPRPHDQFVPIIYGKLVTYCLL